MATTQTVLDYLEEQYRSDVALPPSEWLVQASKLNLLRGAEDKQLAILESNLARVKAAYLEEDMTAAKSKALVEATQEYLVVQQLKAHLSRVTEAIRIAKQMSRSAGEEYRAS